MEIFDVLIKVTAPFITLLAMKLTYRNRIKINFTYFIIAILLSFYLRAFSVPVAGYIDQIKATLLMSYLPSIDFLHLCLAGNYAFEKLKDAYNV